MSPRVLRGASRAVVSLAVLLISAVAIFATLNAARARHAPPLTHTVSSPESLAALVLEGMRAGDVDRLRSLALTRDEFTAHVWPHLPVSRPEVNMPIDFAWNLLQQNSEGFLRQTAAQVTAVPNVRRVEFAGEVTDYGEVTVHRESVVVVADDRGHERRLRVLGSMIEQNGNWKVFSYVID